jgi:hypothetical protein
MAHVVLFGNLSEGYRIFGTFESFSHAADFADSDKAPDVFSWIQEIHSPYKGKYGSLCLLCKKAHCVEYQEGYHKCHECNNLLEYGLWTDLKDEAKNSLDNNPDCTHRFLVEGSKNVPSGEDKVFPFTWEDYSFVAIDVANLLAKDSLSIGDYEIFVHILTEDKDEVPEMDTVYCIVMK